jgi:osmotically-inducible protein OsmY
MKTPLRSLIAVLIVSASIALLAPGCSKTPTRQSTGEFVDDTVVTTKVKAAFAQDPGVKAMDVKVDTFKGTVQLSGFVDNADQKNRAEEIARGIDGVKKVENKINLKTRAQ